MSFQPRGFRFQNRDVVAYTAAEATYYEFNGAQPDGRLVPPVVSTRPLTHGDLQTAVAMALESGGGGGSGVTPEQTIALADAAKGIVSGTMSMAVGIHDAAPASLYSTQNPAAEYDATTNRTYVAYLGGARRLYVTYFDHALAQWGRPQYAGAYAIADINDTHGAPTLAIDQKRRRIVVVYGNHNSQHAVAQSGANCDITSWTVRRVSPTGSYGQIAYDATSEALYFSFRAGTSHGGTYPNHERASILRSVDGGATWTDLGAATGGLIDTKVAYTGDAATDYYGSDFDAINGRLYLSWAIAHGTGHDGPRGGVHVAYYNTADGTMRTAAGVSLGTSINTAAKMTQCRIATGDYKYPIKTGLGPDGKLLTVWNALMPDGLAVGTFAAYFDGTTWQTRDLGVRSNNVYYGTASAWRNGRWEVGCVSRLDGQAVRAETADSEIITGLSSGGDMVILASTDGLSWAIDSQFSRERFTGSGCMYMQAVRNAHADLTMLAQTSTLGSVQPSPTGEPETADKYNTATWTSAIYAVHSRAVLPRLIGSEHRNEVLQRFNPYYKIVNAVTPPATFTTVSLAAVVPDNTTEVMMKVIVVGKGTAGANTVSWRESTTGRSSDAQISSRGEWTDTMVYDVLVPLSPDRSFQWKGDAGLTVTLVPRAVKMSVIARAFDATGVTPPVVVTPPADVSAPTTPGTPVASLSGSTVTVTTSGSTDAVGVTEYRWRRGATTLAPTAGTTLTDAAAPAGSASTYTVAAADAAGNVSAYSSASNAITVPGPADTTPPTTPGTPVATAGVNSASATTTGSTDAVGVSAYRWFMGATEITGQTSTSVTVTGLPAGTAVAFTVEARDAAGNVSTRSAASNSVTPTAPVATGTPETIVFSDSFTRANQGGGLGNGWVVANGTTDSGAIVSNQATSTYNTSGLTRPFRPPTAPTTANHWAQVVVAAGASTGTPDPHIFVRGAQIGATGGVSGYFARVLNGDVQLYRCSTANVTTQLGTVAGVSPAAGYTLRLEIDATHTLRVYINGAIVSGLTYTDATPVLTGVPLLAFRSLSAADNVQRADNFASGDLAIAA